MRKKRTDIRANTADTQEVAVNRQKSIRDYLAQVGTDLPKYARLRHALSKAIDDGFWSSGECLPTETAFTALTPFSLGTIQRAIRALVDEGRVVRVKGHGTYVADKQRGIAQPFLHARFLDDTGGALLPVYPRIISKRLIRDRGPWSDLLNHRGSNIFRIERLLRVSDEFEVLSRFYINTDQFSGFVKKPMSELTSGNFKLMLSREFNLPQISYEQVMELGPLPLDVTHILALKPGTVGTTFRVIAQTGLEVRVYYHELFMPPNHRQLRLPDMVLPTGR